MLRLPTSLLAIALASQPGGPPSGAARSETGGAPPLANGRSSPLSPESRRDEAVVAAVLSFCGAWWPDRDEEAGRDAAKSCGPLLRPGRLAVRRLRPRAARCRLAGIEPSTISAFNAQSHREDEAWISRMAPNGWSADLDGGGVQTVLFHPPLFSPSGRQALVRAEVTRVFHSFGRFGESLSVSFELLVLVALDATGAWGVSGHAVVARRPVERGSSSRGRGPR